MKTKPFRSKKSWQTLLVFAFVALLPTHVARANQYCDMMKQNYESCKNSAAQLPELQKACNDIHKAMVNECAPRQSAPTPGPSNNPASSPGKVKPAKLEREICEAMHFKCGQDSSSSDCRAFQKSAQNNAFRCHLFGNPSASAASASAPPPPSATALHCVSDYLSGSGEEPVINIMNGCNRPISWAMCVNVKGRVAPDRPVGVTAAGSNSRYRLYLKPGQTFTYRYSACEGASCQVTPPPC